MSAGRSLLSNLNGAATYREMFLHQRRLRAKMIRNDAYLKKKTRENEMLRKMEKDMEPNAMGYKI